MIDGECWRIIADDQINDTANDGEAEGITNQRAPRITPHVADFFPQPGEQRSKDARLGTSAGREHGHLQ